jgi:hypothetical protein
MITRKGGRFAFTATSFYAYQLTFHYLFEFIYHNGSNDYAAAKAAVYREFCMLYPTDAHQLRSNTCRKIQLHLQCPVDGCGRSSTCVLMRHIERCNGCTDCYTCCYLSAIRRGQRFPVT